MNGNYMLRRPKRSKNEAVAPKEKEKESVWVSAYTHTHTHTHTHICIQHLPTQNTQIPVTST
jgi:hypothetical protein